MKTKRILILFISIVLLFTAFTFVSCDKQNQNKIIVSIYSNNGNSISAKPLKTVTKNKGDKISLADLTDGKIPSANDFIMLGYYMDANCKIKFDEETIINNDLQLYVYTRQFIPGNSFDSDYCLITYVFDGSKYDIIRNLDWSLDSNDFVISAYGKKIDSSKLKFYLDENYTKELTMPMKKQIIAIKAWDSCPATLTIYVKTEI